MPSLIPSDFPSLVPSSAEPYYVQESGKAASSVKASMTGNSTKGGKKRNSRVEKSDDERDSSSSSEDEEEEETEESVISYANALENTQNTLSDAIMSLKTVGAATWIAVGVMFGMICSDIMLAIMLVTIVAMLLLG
jgi:hypothetical protein